MAVEGLRRPSGGDPGDEGDGEEGHAYRQDHGAVPTDRVPGAASRWELNRRLAMVPRSSCKGDGFRRNGSRYLLPRILLLHSSSSLHLMSKTCLVMLLPTTYGENSRLGDPRARTPPARHVSPRTSRHITRLARRQCRCVNGSSPGEGDERLRNGRVGQAVREDRTTAWRVLRQCDASLGRFNKRNKIESPVDRFHPGASFGYTRSLFFL